MPGDLGDEASKLARQLDIFSGRGDRIPGRVEARWSSSRAQAADLRTHWLFETQPFPIDAVREALDRMGKEAPDDDRVWLGQADLAARTGHPDEADAWLSRCEKRRPDDPDVAKARLSWALDAGRDDVAARALKRLPAGLVPPAELAALSARFAALRGDDAAEREALRRRVGLEPGDSAAWGRLIDLANPPRLPDARREAQARCKAATDRPGDRESTRHG